MATWQSAGKVRMTPKGTWSSSVAYEVLDLVVDANAEKSYLAKQDVPVGTPLTNTTYWDVTSDVSGVIESFNTRANQQLMNSQNDVNSMISASIGRVDDLVEEAANSVAQMQDYTSEYSTRVHGESAVAYGNPMEIYPDEGSLLKPVTEIKVQQEGSGDPYPAGGGKNLIDPKAYAKNSMNTTLNGDVFTTTFQGGGIHVNTLSGGDFIIKHPAGTYTLSTVAVSENVDFYFYFYDAANAVAGGQNGMRHVYLTKAGDVTSHVVTFNTETIITIVGNYQNPIECSYKLQLEQGESYTGYAPYENIRPFIGYDTLNLTRITGKNLFGGKAFADAIKSADKSNTVVINESGGTVVFRSEKTGNVPFYKKLKPNTQYTIILNGKNSNGLTGSNICVYYNDGIQPTYAHVSFSDASTASYGRFVTPEGRSVGSVGVIIYGGVSTLYYDKCGIFEGVVALEDFEAYQGDTYTAYPGQTVYCGSMDWTTGKMLSKGELIDGSLLNWTYWYDHMFFAAPGTYLYDALCEIYPKGSISKNGIFTRIESRGSFYIRDTTLTDGAAGVDELKQKLTGHKIVYLKDKADVSQLTPHQILALKGKNTIYGDGDLTVEYYRPISSLVDRYNALVEATTDPFEVSGNPVTCQTIGHQELEVVTKFEPKQEGSGDPSPDNVRPISGWDALGLNRAGNNLFGGLAFAEKLKQVAGATIDRGAGTVYFTGESVANNPVLFDGFKPDTKYTIILYGKQNNNASRVANLAIIYSDGGAAHYLAFQTAGENSYCVTATVDGRSATKLVGTYVDAGVTLYYDKCGIFEGAVTLEDFEPFIGDIYTALPGQTVYGGRVNWAKGELIDEYMSITLDGSETTWTRYGAINGFTVQIPKMKDSTYAKGWASYIPNGSSFGKYEMIIGSNSNFLYFCHVDDVWGVSTDKELKAYLAAHPLQIVVPRATPIKHQLTPRQITALQGGNTFTGDGTITVKGRQPKHIAIEERVAALESAILNLATTT